MGRDGKKAHHHEPLGKWKLQPQRDYHYTPIRMRKRNNSDNIKTGKGVEKLDHSCIAVEM